MGETAAHLVVGVVDYSRHARGVEGCYQMDPADLAGSHRRNLAAMVEQDGHTLAGKLQLGANAFLKATVGRAAEDLVRWHVGRFLPCADLTCILMGEQLLHGYDIAHTLGAAWSIEAEPARLVVQAILSLLPGLVDSETAKDVDATYELAIDGGPRVIARFHDGACSIDPPGSGPVDGQLSGDPPTWLLALYGRASWEQPLQTDRLTVTQGDAALGARFKLLFRNP